MSYWHSCVLSDIPNSEYDTHYIVAYLYAYVIITDLPHDSITTLVYHNYAIRQYIRHNNTTTSYVHIWSRMKIVCKYAIGMVVWYIRDIVLYILYCGSYVSMCYVCSNINIASSRKHIIITKNTTQNHTHCIIT